jgi:putative glutamine amidotransferase
VPPLIGITSYVEQARWGAWDRECTLVPQVYVTAVHAAGGRALVVPPLPEGVDDVVAALDGLVIAGGNDLDPALYGAERDPRTVGIRPRRDAGEVALLRAAEEADLPVLGICRGMQLMVAVAGGRLVQHLPDVVGHERHQGTPGVYSRHRVDTVPGSRLGGLLGDRFEVPSYHHQGIADAGSLAVSGYADDGTIEGVEQPAAHYRIGVLWHPEQDMDGGLFTGLVAAASAARYPA